jgi:hypothetical protein
MTVSLKNHVLLSLNGVLEKYMGVRHIKIAYALAKNKQALGTALRAYLDLVGVRQKELNALVQPGGCLHEYEGRRQELCQKYAEKDAEGNPKTQGHSYVIENKAAFDNSLQELSREYDKELQERVEIEKVMTDALQEESEFNPYAIPIEVVELSEEGIFEARDLLHLMERGIIIDKDTGPAPKTAAKNDKVTSIKRHKKA